MRDLTQTGEQNVAACIAMVSLTALVLMARFAVRASQQQVPFAADWLCFLSALPFYAYCGLILHFILSTSVDGSFDINITHGLQQLVIVLKLSYVLEILFGVVITTVKLSILLFYRKVFATNSGNTLNQRIIQVMAVTCIVWFVTVTFVVIFQCHPIHAYWDQFAMPPYCMDNPTVFLGYELTNLFSDVFILCIPLPIVWRLNLQTSKRISLTGIFLLGAFVCVASIVRLTAIWNLPNIDANFRFSDAFMWSTLQMGVAITCACLPTLAPVLPVLVKPFSYIRSWSVSRIWSRSNVNSEGQGGRSHKVSDEYELTQVRDVQPAHAAKAGGSFYGASRSWARRDNTGASTESGVRLGPPMSITVDRNVEVV